MALRCRPAGTRGQYHEPGSTAGVLRTARVYRSRPGVDSTDTQLAASGHDARVCRRSPSTLTSTATRRKRPPTGAQTRPHTAPGDGGQRGFEKRGAQAVLMREDVRETAQHILDGTVTWDLEAGRGHYPRDVPSEGAGAKATPGVAPFTCHVQQRRVQGQMSGQAGGGGVTAHVSGFLWEWQNVLELHRRRWWAHSTRGVRKPPPRAL